MRIIFSKHALLKLDQRRISKKLVTATVTTPDHVDFQNSRVEHVYKRFRARYLKVVVEKRKAHVIIVTTHWVAKVRFTR